MRVKEAAVASPGTGHMLERVQCARNHRGHDAARQREGEFTGLADTHGLNAGSARRCRFVTSFATLIRER